MAALHLATGGVKIQYLGWNCRPDITEILLTKVKYGSTTEGGYRGVRGGKHGSAKGWWGEVTAWPRYIWLLEGLKYSI